MDTDKQTTKKLFGTDSSMGLFVSLYLILFAFFIILNAISNQTVIRTAAVMESVSDTFKADNPGRNDDVQLDVDEPAIGPTDSILTDIRGLFETEFNIPGKIPAGGQGSVEFTFPTRFLFADGSLIVRSDSHPFLQSLIRIMDRNSTRRPVELLFLFGSDTGSEGANNTQLQELAIRRAGSLARFMRSSGVRDGAYGTGFTALDTEEIRVLVHHRSAPDSDQ